MPKSDTWPCGATMEPLAGMDSAGSCDSVVSVNSGSSEDSLEHLSAEEKACLMFLEETIQALDTEEDSGLSTDEPDGLPAPGSVASKMAHLSASMDSSALHNGSKHSWKQPIREVGKPGFGYLVPTPLVLANGSSGLLSRSRPDLTPDKENSRPGRQTLPSDPKSRQGSPRVPSEVNVVVIPPPTKPRDPVGGWGSEGACPRGPLSYEALVQLRKSASMKRVPESPPAVDSSKQPPGPAHAMKAHPWNRQPRDLLHHQGPLHHQDHLHHQGPLHHQDLLHHQGPLHQQGYLHHQGPLHHQDPLLHQDPLHQDPHHHQDPLHHQDHVHHQDPLLYQDHHHHQDPLHYDPLHHQEPLHHQDPLPLRHQNPHGYSSSPPMVAPKPKRKPSSLSLKPQSGAASSYPPLASSPSDRPLSDPQRARREALQKLGLLRENEPEPPGSSEPQPSWGMSPHSPPQEDGPPLSRPGEGQPFSYTNATPRPPQSSVLHHHSRPGNERPAATPSPSRPDGPSGVKAATLERSGVGLGSLAADRATGPPPQPRSATLGGQREGGAPKTASPLARPAPQKAAPVVGFSVATTPSMDVDRREALRKLGLLKN